MGLARGWPVTEMPNSVSVPITRRTLIRGPCGDGSPSTSSGGSAASVFVGWSSCGVSVRGGAPAPRHGIAPKGSGRGRDVVAFVGRGTRALAWVGAVGLDGNRELGGLQG